MGEQPGWYRTLRAARYLGVAPWDLAERAVWWTEVALAAEAAEAHASEMRSKRSAVRSKASP